MMITAPMECVSGRGNSISDHATAPTQVTMIRERGRNRSEAIADATTVSAIAAPATMAKDGTSVRLSAAPTPLAAGPVALVSELTAPRGRAMTPAKVATEATVPALAPFCAIHPF